MITLTDQDLRDLKLACESVMIGGMTISDARKIVVRFTLLGNKLEEILNERNSESAGEEHSAVSSDSHVNEDDRGNGDVGS